MNRPKLAAVPSPVRPPAFLSKLAEEAEIAEKVFSRSFEQISGSLGQLALGLGDEDQLDGKEALREVAYALIALSEMQSAATALASNVRFWAEKHTEEASDG